MDATEVLATSIDFQLRLPAVEAWLSGLLPEEHRRVIGGLCAALSGKLAQHQTIVARRLGEWPGSAAEIAKLSALGAAPVETAREGDHRLIDDFDCFARLARLAQAPGSEDAALAEIFDDMPETLAVVPDLVRELSLRLRPPETEAVVASLVDAAVQRALATVADLGLRIALASWHVWPAPTCNGLLARERELTTSLAAPLAYWLGARGTFPDLSARAIAARSSLPAPGRAAASSFVQTLRGLRELHAPLGRAFDRARDMATDGEAIAMLEMSASLTTENAANLAEVLAAAEKLPELT